MRLAYRLPAIAGAVLLLATCGPAQTVNTRPTPDLARMVAENVAVFNGFMPILKFPTPLAYTFLRHQVETCSGLTREGWPTFWVAPLVLLNSEGAVGLYIRGHRQIIFALGYETVPWAIRHEILHDLVDAPVGSPAHPPEYFAEKCALLVYPIAPARSGSSGGQP